MQETEFKRDFKRSVRQYGGLAISLSANHYAGLPDLYILLPGYTPLLVEAKFLKKINTKFKRKIPYSPLQRKLLDDCNTIQHGTAFGLVGFSHNKRLHACLVPYSIESIDHNYEQYCGVSSLTNSDKYFDVPLMLDKLGLNNVKRNSDSSWNSNLAISKYKSA